MDTLPQYLSEEQEALLPSDDDVAFYEQHGWFVSGRVLPDDIIDRAIEGSERYYRGERDMPFPLTSGYCDWKPQDADIVRNNEFVSLQNSDLRRLALQPIIGAIAARLARTRRIRLLDDQLIYKPAGVVTQSAVGWHTDRAYWPNCTSDKMLTAWIPFHDCDEARGPLVVIDGSHKWSGLEDLRFFNDQHLEDIEAKLLSDGREVVRVPMIVRKGQISFHHCRTIHGSCPNRSGAFRLALAVHLQDDANRYRPFRNAAGKELHMIDEKLCRTLSDGSPDFTDPSAFPTLWSEGGG
jgi:phytanoyl-CoA dioxygenase PhyH